ILTPATDQRGYARTRNGAVDIGAVEWRGPHLTVSGDGQFTPPNTPFPQPLFLHLQQGDGPTSPSFAGVAVTFTAPASGASIVPSLAVVTTDANRDAVLPITANGIFGTFTLTATTSFGPLYTFHLSSLEAPSLVVTTTQ